MYVPPGPVAQLKWSKKVKNLIKPQGLKNILYICLLRNVPKYRFACFTLVSFSPAYATVTSLF